MKKRKKKIVGSMQRGVYVSAATKKEFKKNKEQLKNEGIKSAYSLQIQKDIAKRAKIRANSGITRKEREYLELVYENSLDYKETGYSFQHLKKIFKDIKKAKRQIENAIKKGKLPYNTSTPYLPVDKNHRINMKRLDRMAKKAKEPISKKLGNAYRNFDDNVNALFSKDDALELIRLAHKIPAGLLYKELESEPVMNVIVIYDWGDFVVESRPDVESIRDEIFASIGGPSSYDYLYDLLTDILRKLGKDW